MLKRIEYRTFKNCYNLENIKLPEKLEYIGKQSFEGSYLKEVTIPESVSFIGDNAFNFYSLKTVYVVEGHEEIVKGSIRDYVTVSVVKSE